MGVFGTWMGLCVVVVVLCCFDWMVTLILGSGRLVGE